MGALTVLGWALALVLVLALAALVLPACLSLDWRAGQLTVRARLLCFGFRLWPLRPKTPRQLARQAQREAARAEKKERKQTRKAEKQRRKAEKARQKAERARAAAKAAGAAKSEKTAGAPPSADKSEGKGKANAAAGQEKAAGAKGTKKAAGAKGGKKAAPKKGLAENLRRLSCLVSRAGWAKSCCGKSRCAISCWWCRCRARRRRPPPGSTAGSGPGFRPAWGSCSGGWTFALTGWNFCRISRACRRAGKFSLVKYRPD